MSVRRIFSVLGIVFVFLLVVAGAIFGYLHSSKSRLDESSKAFVDSSVPLIAATWSKGNLLNRSSIEFKKSVEERPREFDAFLSTLSQLGALKQYKGSRGGANVFLDSAKGKVVTAQYVAEATMEHGEVYFSLRLVQRDGDWQFQSFDVRSPEFCHASDDTNCLR